MRWRAKDKNKWHDWFAWFPVRTDNGCVAWFETVRRINVGVPGYDTMFKYVLEIPAMQDQLERTADDGGERC